ncbi:MAG: hypothetical protein ABL907_16025 [Hyphomicrobium sp.]
MSRTGVEVTEPVREEAAGRPRKVGLVVVHGVGETEPGYCIASVFATLQRTSNGYTIDGYAISDRQEEKFGALYDSASPQKNAESKEALSKSGPGEPYYYPVFLRGGRHQSGLTLSGVELYWADTTTLHPGRLNTLLGLFRVIFESQHIVHAMLDRGRDRAAWLARVILLFAAWLLRGPIAALTIATSAFCAVLMFEPDWLKSLYGPERAQFVLTHFVLLVGSVWALHRIVRHQDFSWYDAAVWLASFCIGLIALDQFGWLFPVLDKACEVYRDGVLFVPAFDANQLDCRHSAAIPGSYVNGPYRGIILLWRLWGLLLVMSSVVFAVVWLRTRKVADRSVVTALSTSIGILVLQFLLWVTVVVSVLYPMLNRAEANRSVTQQTGLLLSGVERAVGPGTPQKQDFDRYVGDLVRDQKLTEIIGLTDINPEWIVRFKFIYVSGTLTLLALIAAIIGLMTVRRKRATEGLDGYAGEPPADRLEKNARSMPRLLFNQGLIGLLIISFLVVFALVLFQVNLEEYELFKTMRSVLLTVTAIAASIVSLTIGPRITNVVHIARDLIDHHYRPGLESAPSFLKRRMRKDELLPRRDRIRARLIKVLEEHIKPGGFDDVIFVAHSQGSVIAYDYIRDHGPGYPELGGARPSLLTFGSPIGTIYQTYFCEYQKDAPVSDGMRNGLKAWVNLYRVDDYIGGRIEPPDGVSIQNIAMKSSKHRHTEYWIEDKLGLALDRLVNPPEVPPHFDIPETAGQPRAMPALW